MTCIVGAIDKKTGDVFIGADSFSGNYSMYEVSNISKLVLLNTDDGKQLLIGATSSWRMIQLLEHSVVLPSIKEQPPLKYLVKEFIPRIRTVFKDGGFSEVHNNVEEGGTFLVGFQKRLFRVQDDFAIGESTYHYDSVGAGYMVALGAMHVANGHFETTEAITFALNAAQKHTPFVCAPFYIESV